MATATTAKALLVLLLASGLLAAQAAKPSQQGFTIFNCGGAQQLGTPAANRCCEVRARLAVGAQPP